MKLKNTELKDCKIKRIYMSNKMIFICVAMVGLIHKERVTN